MRTPPTACARVAAPRPIRRAQAPGRGGPVVLGDARKRPPSIAYRRAAYADLAADGRPLEGPVFHPAHKWRPCPVTLPGGEPCGCTSSTEPRRLVSSEAENDGTRGRL